MNAYELIGWLGRHVGRTAHLCLDSRQLQRGDVFFACPGLHADGRDYIDEAVRRGAAAVIIEGDNDEKPVADPGVPFVQVTRLGRVLGQVAHHWYREPSHALSVVAVTGTNGKTTCVNWIASALNAQGLACGTIGTLGVVQPDGRNLGGELTTPDVLTMHRSLAALRDAGAVVVALEASSIGIQQGRLDHVKIEIAAFTNLTHDHLDYHQTLQAYKEAKFRLFSWPQLGAAVINIDDPAGRELLEMTDGPEPLTYSTLPDSHADIQASDIQASGYGLVFNLKTPRGSSQLLTRLVGVHNVSNLLLVTGVLRQLGWGMSRTVRVLGALVPVEGRLQTLEAIDCGAGGRPQPMVVVDYAHSPDALARALQALQETAKARGGNLVCVFGCGGSRDQSKRPMMGTIAAQHADRVILTNDNPRDEDPQAIISQIVSGMPETPQIELDRASAILQAIWHADEKDVILVAGKGHETEQELADRKIPFDDREWGRLALTWLRDVPVSTDTRSLQPGQLFVAVAGDRFDGHDYLEQARDAGACAAVVSRPDPGVALPQIVLGNTRQALARWATVWRSRFSIPVIGVTGSNGKTTTKEMIAAILRQWQGEDHVLATQGNLNNELGVPLTLLRLRASHQVAVVEMGMNHPGEISRLAAMAGADVALVNNAQREHQEFMQSVAAVARENGAVIEALGIDGVAVFPGDDAYAGLWADLAGGRPIVRFGFDPAYEVWADQVHAQPDRTDFHLHTPQGAGPVVLRAQGRHNLHNALAAAACATAVHAPFASIVRGLEQFDAVPGRMQSRPLRDGFHLIDDTYNANPDSVRAAIEALADMQGRRVLVLGDMGEVGPDGDAVHAEVGAYARDCGIDALVTLGPASAHAAQAFGQGASAHTTLDALCDHLFALMPAHVLVKGSRSARMERVVQALEDHLAAKAAGGDDAA